MFGSKLFDPVALASTISAAPGSAGLDIVEEEIRRVVTTLQDQKTEIAGLDFASTAHIGKGSFGAGSEASQLATDHTKAHGVIVDTLDAMIGDLDRFQTAVTEARALFGEADDRADEQVRVVLASVDQLDLGDQAQRDAQVRHSGDLPTDEAPAAGEGL